MGAFSLDDDHWRSRACFSFLCLFLWWCLRWISFCLFHGDTAEAPSNVRIHLDASQKEKSAAYNGIRGGIVMASPILLCFLQLSLLLFLFCGAPVLFSGICAILNGFARVLLSIKPFNSFIQPIKAVLGFRDFKLWATVPSAVVQRTRHMHYICSSCRDCRCVWCLHIARDWLEHYSLSSNEHLCALLWMPLRHQNTHLSIRRVRLRLLFVFNALYY